MYLITFKHLQKKNATGKAAVGKWPLNEKVSLYIDFDTEYTGDMK